MFAKSPNIIMLTVLANSGAVYAVEKTKSFSVIEFYRLWEKVKLKHPYFLSEPERYVDCIQDLLMEVGICGLNYYTTRL